MLVLGRKSVTITGLQYTLSISRTVCSFSPVATAYVLFLKQVESEGKPVTNQENSGRCWLFAALNVMRLPFMKKYAIEEFEFSQR